jgi:hypothetical protein
MTFPLPLINEDKTSLHNLPTIPTGQSSDSNITMVHISGPDPILMRTNSRDSNHNSSREMYSLSYTNQRPGSNSEVKFNTFDLGGYQSNLNDTNNYEAGYNENSTLTRGTQEKQSSQQNTNESGMGGYGNRANLNLTGE